MTSRRHATRDQDPLHQRLLGAFVVSLLAHLSVFGVARVGQQLQWWDAKALNLFQTVKITPEELEKLREQQRKAEEEREKQQPVMFIQVTQPSTEPPPEAKFYSSVSARAANPDPGREREAKIDGKQDQMARLADAPRIATGRPTPPPQPEAPGTADASPQSVSAPVPVPAPEPPPRPVPVTEPSPAPKLVEQRPEPARVPGLGELAMVRPEVRRPDPVPVEASAESAPAPTPPVQAPPPTPASTQPPREARSRPRTVTEAKLRQELLAGQKMRQDGGVERKGPVQLDAVGRTFGAYDEALVGAVQTRWFALLDDRKYVGGAAGRVVVRFKLYADGSVRGCQAAETSVDPLFTELCVRAVSDPAPYEKWPVEMLRELGTNMREMRFTFLYN